MDKGDGSTKYMLEGEGVGSVFVIDSKTGNIHVTKSLDREEKDEYRLVATATDRETGRALEPSSEFIIRVQDINDNPPVFPNEPYVAMVPEMANIGMQQTTLQCNHTKCPERWSNVSSVLPNKGFVLKNKTDTVFFTL